MKAFALISLLALSTQAFGVSVFKCKEDRAVNATLLYIDAEGAQFGGELLNRDRQYVPGNNGKKYDRFTNENLEILVPTLMTKNRTNQGVIVTYSTFGKIRFSCIK